MEFLHEEYLEFLCLLEQKEVKYLLIGGLAVNVHGYHRATGDMDILYQNTSQNIERLHSALEDFGYEIGDLKSYDFKEETHLRLGEPPNSIDIINSTKGIDYEKAFSRAIKASIKGMTVSVIHINDLIANKKALNTYKDLADAEALQEIKRKSNIE